jgi:hypothetical protein
MTPESLRSNPVHLDDVQEPIEPRLAVAREQRNARTATPQTMGQNQRWKTFFGYVRAFSNNAPALRIAAQPALLSDSPKEITQPNISAILFWFFFPSWFFYNLISIYLYAFAFSWNGADDWFLRSKKLCHQSSDGDHQMLSKLKLALRTAGPG